MIVGDFNNGAQWDKPGRADNFVDLTNAFLRCGLVSAYYHFHREEFGAEGAATFFSRRQKDSAYHIDYCFLPESWTGCLDRVEVGGYDEWIGLSDHMPLTLEISNVMLLPTDSR